MKSKKIKRTLKSCYLDDADSVADASDHQPGELIGPDDDLLTEILRRLPAASVLRFKSVSKHWLSLLSHRHFTIMFNKFSVPLGLFYSDLYVPFDVENRNIRPPFRTLNFHPDCRGVEIVQSCNGLLLCGSDYDPTYYVFNPTTKKFAVIPSIKESEYVCNFVSFMGLAFHPIVCVHYKLVCIYFENLNNEDDERVFQIQIYSSDTGNWKISNASFSAPLDTPFTCGVYWNGAIHWAPTCLNSLYFKLDEEVVRKLPLPYPMKMASSPFHIELPLYFGESRGHLHLVQNDDRKKPLHLNVYEMLSDHSGWFVKFQVELDELQHTYLEMSYNYDYGSVKHDDFRILDVVRSTEDEEERYTFMVVKVPGKIKSYNILAKSFKHLFDIPSVYYGQITQMEVHRYIETLVSVT